MIYILCNNFARAVTPDERRTPKTRDRALRDTIDKAKDGDILMIDDPDRAEDALGLILVSGKKIEIWEVEFVTE